MQEKREDITGDSSAEISVEKSRQSLVPESDQEYPEAQRALVDALVESGDVFDPVPEGIEPGLLLSTPTVLRKKGITRYSVTHQGRLVRSGDVDGFAFGDQVWLTPKGVAQLIEREQASKERVQQKGGKLPGQRNSRRGRVARSSLQEGASADIFDASQDEADERPTTTDAGALAS